jgi:hypothetical protein
MKSFAHGFCLIHSLHTHRASHVAVESHHPKKQPIRPWHGLPRDYDWLLVAEPDTPDKRQGR